MLKKTVSVCLCLLMLLSVAACGNTAAPAPAEPANSAAPADSPSTSNPAQSEPGDIVSPSSEPVPFDEYPRPKISDSPKIVYILGDWSDNMTLRMWTQLQIEGKHRGWDVTDARYSAESELVDVWKNVIQQEPDAIWLNTISSFESYQYLVEECREKGIGVYVTDSNVVPGVIAKAGPAAGISTTQVIYKACADHNFDLSIATGCVGAIASHLERTRYVAPIFEMTEYYPNLHLIDASENIADATSDISMHGYDVTLAWVNKYGDELDAIFLGADGQAMNASEAIISSGDTDGSRTFVMSSDGGPEAWTYIRNNTPYKYCNALPGELYIHTLCDVVQELQVEGRNIGENTEVIQFAGQSYLFGGSVVTRDNVPDVGATIHEAFDYYDPNAGDDVWYKWEPDMIYIIGE